MSANVFDPRTANSQGVGGYDWKAILAAQSDQQMGLNMLMRYLTGSSDIGTGPFAGFMEQLLAPLATSAINAMTLGNGQTPTNIDDLFSRIASTNGGAAGNSIYDYLGGLAQKAVGTKLAPGSNMSFDELSNMLKILSPLVTTGMDPISAHQFQRQQTDALTDMQAPSYWDMGAQNGRKDWGDFFTQSPFFKQYYGNAPRGAGGPPTMSSVVMNGQGNKGGGMDNVSRYRLAGQAGATGGGGGGGMYNP